MNVLRTVKAIDKDRVRLIYEAQPEPSIGLRREACFQAIYHNAAVFERLADGRFVASEREKIVVSDSLVAYVDGMFTLS